MQPFGLWCSPWHTFLLLNIRRQMKPRTRAFLNQPNSQPSLIISQCPFLCSASHISTSPHPHHASLPSSFSCIPCLSLISFLACSNSFHIFAVSSMPSWLYSSVVVSISSPSLVLLSCLASSASAHLVRTCSTVCSSMPHSHMSLSLFARYSLVLSHFLIHSRCDRWFMRKCGTRDLEFSLAFGNPCFYQIQQPRPDSG